MPSVPLPVKIGSDITRKNHAYYNTAVAYSDIFTRNIGLLSIIWYAASAHDLSKILPENGV